MSFLAYVDERQQLPECTCFTALKFNQKMSSFVFRRWTKVLRVWYRMGV